MVAWSAMLVILLQPLLAMADCCCKPPVQETAPVQVSCCAQHAPCSEPPPPTQHDQHNDDNCDKLCCATGQPMNGVGSVTALALIGTERLIAETPNRYPPAESSRLQRPPRVLASDC